MAWLRTWLRGRDQTPPPAPEPPAPEPPRGRDQTPPPAPEPPAPEPPRGVDAPATASDIQSIMQTLLGRTTSEEHVRQFQEQGSSVLDVMNVIRHSMELRSRITEEGDAAAVTVHAAAKEADVRALFVEMLGRDIVSSGAQRMLEGQPSVLDMIRIIKRSDEFMRAVLSRQGLANTGQIEGAAYRLPSELQQAPTRPARVLMVGSCLMGAWHMTYASTYPETAFDYVLFNNASVLPEMDAATAAGYDFQLVQVPLRSIIPESTYFQLRYSDAAGYERLFEDACTRLRHNLGAILAYNIAHGMLTFVTNFYTVQQNPMGRMQDRYSLSNMTFFIERLNQELYLFCRSQRNVHVVDFDEIINTFGKKYAAEDLVATINHGSMLVDIASAKDGVRLEPIGSVTELYGPQPEKYMLAPFEEAVAMVRTLTQTDSIKLVIFDLDDTLWRGVAAELDDIDLELVEGWPLGVLEAISYLWRRGIMVAIVSKNDPENVRAIWGRLYGVQFPLERFVQVAVNWRPKAENVAEIMAAVNLLPNSVLFVDDNPVERAAMQAAFPEMRVMDEPVVSWRRILLWAPELQRAVVTDEAAARTEMVQAQIEREGARVSLGKAEFLASLGLRVSAAEVLDRADRRFDRCFELINKTNQFNTTGGRWSPAEAQLFLDAGGYFVAIDVADSFTQYGLTGVIAIEGTTLRQFVLSCRVFGMQVEHAAVTAALRSIRSRSSGPVRALAVDTPKNLLSRTIYADMGFSREGEAAWCWTGSEPPAPPTHLELSLLRGAARLEAVGAS